MLAIMPPEQIGVKGAGSPGWAKSSQLVDPAIAVYAFDEGKGERGPGSEERAEYMPNL
jgi:hypothetical protein